MGLAKNYEISRVSFTVPVTSGQYAPERIMLTPVSDAKVGLLGLQLLVEQALAACTIEVWMASAAATDYTLDASFFLSSMTFSGAAAGSIYFPLVSWPAVQLRVKSGGTSGSLIVNASAD